MLILRAATKEDEEQLIQLWYDLNRYHQLQNHRMPLREDWREYKQLEMQWLVEQKRSRIIVAELAKKIVGYIKATIRKNAKMYDIENEGWIEEIYVLPSYRNVGLGKMLVMSMMKKLTEENIEQVHIHVDINNTGAELFWNQLGFETVAIQKTLSLKKR